MKHDYMSDAARKYLEDAPEAGPPLSAHTLERCRAEARAEFLPRGERAVERAGVSVTECKIGGVPCLEIAPRAAAAPGTILYCYGGGFVTGSAREDLIVSAALAARAGARVIAVDYRLAPEHPFPAAPEDGWAVYRALSDGPGPLAIAGESAGGNLALTVMQRARAEGLAQPCAAALLSPWCDLTHGGDSLRINDGRDPTLTRDFVVAAAEMYAGGADRGDPAISPLFAEYGPEFPPALITTGTRDLLMSPSIALARRMRAAGMEVALDVHDGLWHVFEFYDELPEAADSLDALGGFLGRHLQAA